MASRWIIISDCALASRQVSVLASSLKLDGIVRGIMDSYG